MSRVVVPLDESELAEEALPWAALLARAYGDSVHLVAVYTYDERIWMRAGVSGDATPAAIADAVEGYLRDVASSEVLAGVRVTTEVRLGNVAEEVTEVAAAGDTRYVVLASHGQGGLRRWARGSVADELVRASEVPVVVVRPGIAPSLDRILLPLDGSSTSEQALPAVRALAAAASAEVHLIRVVNPVSEVAWTGVGPGPDLGQLTEQLTEAAHDYLAEVAQPGDTTDVFYGRPLDAILEYARARDCSIIAMGTHGRGGIVRLALGSTTDAVVRGADRPVLVVPASLEEDD